MGSRGQLGHNSHCFKQRTVMLEEAGKCELHGCIIAQVATGYEFTIVLTTEGSIYMFGDNTEGQLGDGTSDEGIIKNLKPKLVGGPLKGKKVTYVAAGKSHTVCVTEGDTYTWGSGQYGQLGHGDNVNHFIPKLGDGLVGEKATGAACGRYRFKLFEWFWNNFGFSYRTMMMLLIAVVSIMRHDSERLPLIFWRAYRCLFLEENIFGKSDSMFSTLLLDLITWMDR